MLMPKRVKHRKQHRGRLTGVTKGGATVDFGDSGSPGARAAWITARQIEAARIAMTRHVRRGGKVWIRIFPDKPVTQKPAETRMGSGKGNPEHLGRAGPPGTDPLRAVGVDTHSHVRHRAERSRSSRSRHVSSLATDRRRRARWSI